MQNTHLVQEAGAGLCFSTFPPGPAHSQVAQSLFLLSQVEAIPDQLLKQVVSVEAMLDFLPEAEKMAQQLGLPPIQVSQGREGT